MFEAALAQLRFIIAMLLGQPLPVGALERLIEALRQTRREFGPLNPEAAELLRGPTLDEAARRDFQLRRFQTQAARAARETEHYAHLFASLHLNPAQLRDEDILRLPLALAPTGPDSLTKVVARSARPALRVELSASAGPPAALFFSAYELRLLVALNAIELLLQEQAQAEDVVYLSFPPCDLLRHGGWGSAYARLGALVQPAGHLPPAQALARLAQSQAAPGKKSRPSILLAYPSYLGALVACGLRSGYGPADFGLERIVTSGEILTAGLKARCRRLFGPVQFWDRYSVTALLPFEATGRADGYLEFGLLPGLLELINPATGAPAQAGEVGVLVATPFRPYRDTTLLLRYDIQDVARPGPEPGLTSPVLGKLAHCVRHADGWTCPRQVQEAVEAVEDTPLPARYSMRAVADGVGVELLVRENTAEVYRLVESSLQEQGVLLRELRLVTDVAQLQHPLPVRYDGQEKREH
jgi:phenylacetate-coenzyme A ligase PaaK-like adenylate-forming protein